MFSNIKVKKEGMDMLLFKKGKYFFAKLFTLLFVLSVFILFDRVYAVSWQPLIDPIKENSTGYQLILSAEKTEITADSIDGTIIGVLLKASQEETGVLEKPGIDTVAVRLSLGTKGVGSLSQEDITLLYNSEKGGWYNEIKFISATLNVKTVSTLNAIVVSAVFTSENSENIESPLGITSNELFLELNPKEEIKVPEYQLTLTTSKTSMKADGKETANISVLLKELTEIDIAYDMRVGVKIKLSSESAGSLKQKELSLSYNYSKQGWYGETMFTSSVLTSEMQVGIQAAVSNITNQPENAKLEGLSSKEEFITLSPVDIPQFSVHNLSITKKEKSKKISISNMTDITNVEWKSSNTDIASVNNGTVTVYKDGVADITAVITTTYGTYEDRCLVVVTGFTIYVTGINLDMSSMEMTKTENIKKLTATILPKDADNKKINWSSSNYSIAQVSEDGTVTAYGDGTAIITAITEDGGYSAECKVSVTGFSIIDVLGVSFNKSNLSLTKANPTYTLEANVYPKDATNKVVYWSSSDSSVVSVAKGGKITAKKDGTATIKIRTEDGNFIDTCVVTVNGFHEQLELQGKASYKKVYGSSSFYLIISSAGSRKLGYSSSNFSVASVSDDGKVSVRGIGTATITVTAYENDNYFSSKKDIIITVTPQKQQLVSVKSSSKKIKVTWKKGKKIDGYQLAWSEYSSFINSAYSSLGKKKISTFISASLKKGHRYYVRIRGYKKKGGKTYKGPWSKMKTVIVR